MAQSKSKIVIIGSGFGGITAAQEIGKLLKPDEAETVLVSKTNHLVFTPMLAEAAAGALSTQNVTESGRAMLEGSGVELLVAEVVSINLEEKKVHTADRELPFDYLIISTGSTTNFFGTPGAEEFCLTLKNAHDSEQIKSRLIAQFEKAANTESKEEQKHLLAFAAIGGGPTGIELVTEINDLIQETMADLYPQLNVKQEATLTVLDMAPFILMPFAPEQRERALKAVQDQGIKVLLNSSVTAITAEGVQLGDGKMIPASTVYWTAGVKALIPHITPDVPMDKGGRLTVEKDMSIPGHSNVFVIGDAASFMVGERPLPMLAQVAVRQAPVAAENIMRTMRNQSRVEFSYKLQGSLATLGHGKAVADFGKMQIWGWPAWIIWRMVYLFEFRSWNRRLKVINEWIIAMGAPRDISQPDQ